MHGSGYSCIVQRFDTRTEIQFTCNTRLSRNVHTRWWICSAQIRKCLTSLHKYVLIARTHATRGGYAREQGRTRRRDRELRKPQQS